MLYDKAKIYVEGGRGGDGIVSFRREAHVPKGGPDGGDGGRGGDVVLVCEGGRRDLASLGASKHFRAGRGAHGQGSRKHGERGEDRVIAVPPGTVVAMLDGSAAELLADGQRLVVARGGGGGHGNKRFATSTRQSPRFAERGLGGESGWIELRLKLLADVGLVGLPNAGKSSLLARMTRAKPKVADYPFTTLEPALGAVRLEDGQIVLADIPGLIEGAAEGAGLGHEFLAHVERCRLLVHLVEIGGACSSLRPGKAEAGGWEAAARGRVLHRADSDGGPGASYAAVRDELGSYGARLDRLPEIVALSKADLVPDERAAELVREWRRRLGDAVADVVAISSATGAGLDELRRAIVAALPDAPSVGAVAAEAEQRGSAGEFEVEHRVYRPGEEEGFEVEAAGEGRWRLAGRGIELLFARHDLSNPEALDYLEGRLREIGVIAELERAGFEAGDEVIVGEAEFELDP